MPFETDLNYIREAFLDQRPQEVVALSLHSLLVGFLTFMTTEYNPTEHALSISNPFTVLINREHYIQGKKEQFGNSKSTSLKEFAQKLHKNVYIVEDPINPAYNPARLVRRGELNEEEYAAFFLALRRAAASSAQRQV